MTDLLLFFDGFYLDFQMFHTDHPYFDPLVTGTSLTAFQYSP